MARVRALVAHDVGWDVRIALDYFLLYGVIWGGRKGKWFRWKSSAGDAGGEKERTSDVSRVCVCMCMCERAEGGPLEARGYGVTVRNIDLRLQQVLHLTRAARGVATFGGDSFFPPARCC